MTDRDAGQGPRSVFVSYSREDGAIVGVVVELLRAVHADVFQDVVSIPKGRKWKDEIERALVAADLLIVFWCSHSRRSKWVRREYESAIHGDKEVLPVLIDKTPVPRSLAEYQHLDASEMLRLVHDRPEPPPSPRRSRFVLWGGAASSMATAVTLVVGSLWRYMSAALPPGIPPDELSYAPPDIIAWPVAILALALLALSVAFFAISKRGPRTVPSFGHDHDAAEQLAGMIAAAARPESQGEGS